MATLIACPRCRTVVPPGQLACMRCGHAVDEPTRTCNACEHRNDPRSRFCAQCGHSLAELVSMSPAPVRPADTTGVLLDQGPRPRPYLIALGVLVALGIVVGGLQVVDHQFFSPTRTVDSFFAALAARDAAAARRLLAPSYTDYASMPLLQSAALRPGGYTPPSAARVEHADTAGDRATVRVSFALGGGRHALDLDLEKDQHATAGLFHRWHINGGVYDIDIATAGLSSVLVAGSPIPLAADTGSTSLTAFPGGYRVSLPDQPLWTAAPVVTFAGAGDALAAAALEPTIKDSARSAVNDQVRTYLEDCAKSTAMSPPNCPFAAYAYEQVRNVHWKIATYPEFELTSGYDGRLVVSTVMSGEAEVTGSVAPSYGGGAYPYSDSRTFTVSGAVILVGNQITFRPGQD
jgi:double zinc ribbon protein